MATPFFEGNIEDLLRMLAGMAQEGVHQRERDEKHESSDPKNYDRAVEVTDGEALLLVTAFYRKQEELEEAAEHAQTLHAELVAARGRMFAKLAKLYPDVKQGSSHTGIRRRQVDRLIEVNYVGWDD